jgi:hypothetical protein
MKNTTKIIGPVKIERYFAITHYAILIAYRDLRNDLKKSKLYEMGYEWQSMMIKDLTQLRHIKNAIT